MQANYEYAFILHQNNFLAMNFCSFSLSSACKLYHKSTCLLLPVVLAFLPWFWIIVHPQVLAWHKPFAMYCKCNRCYKSVYYFNLLSSVILHLLGRTSLPELKSLYGGSKFGISCCKNLFLLTGNDTMRIICFAKNWKVED